MENWIRKWQPTPVFLPGKFHGPKSLAGYSPWVGKSRTRLRTHEHTHWRIADLRCCVSFMYSKVNQVYTHISTLL